MIWQCPKCQHPLTERDRNLCCDNGHSYDRARQGYIHLLLANQKNSRNPGDNEEMIAARKRFLRAGFYAPLVDEVFAMVKAYLSSQDTVQILDLGCGEGYYLESLSEKLLSLESIGRLDCCGVDVSKEAIRKAASSAKQKVHSNTVHEKKWRFDYGVASNHHLPVMENSVDIALNVFAPIAVREIQRVLKNTGMFVRVQPAERHLYQLKEVVYGEVKLHTLADVEPELLLLARKNLHFTLDLIQPDSIADLLAMTPLNWHGQRDAKSELIEKGKLTLEVDFDIQLLGIKSE